MQGFYCYIDQLNKCEERYDRLCELLTFEEVLVDKKLFLKLTSEKRDLESFVQLYVEYKKLQAELNDLNELKGLSCGQDEYTVIEENIAMISDCINKIKLELVQKLMLYNSSEDNICVEIVLAKGASAHVLKENLTKIYSLWCDSHKFEYSCQGLKDNTKLTISGKGAKDVFVGEIGSHEIIDEGVSSCNVFVYDIHDIATYKLGDDEISIEICRSSGAGGQHINTTDSAVKATHIPTGITAICQDERNQLQNKIKAMERLKEKVNKAVSAQNEENIKKQKKTQIQKLKSSQPVRVYDLKNDTIIQGSNKYCVADFEKGVFLQK